MAEIIKRIGIDEEYVFELVIRSKTVHAHSMMTDNDFDLKGKISGLKDTLEPELKELSRKHKEVKK